jgi:hypothetical protein
MSDKVMTGMLTFDSEGFACSTSRKLTPGDLRDVERTISPLAFIRSDSPGVIQR